MRINVKVLTIFSVPKQIIIIYEIKTLLGVDTKCINCSSDIIKLDKKIPDKVFCFIITKKNYTLIVYKK